MTPSTSAQACASTALSISRAYHGRLKQWLNRFHGVATHYLDNYLGWFRSLDNHHASSSESVLAMALGKFPHLTVT